MEITSSTWEKNDTIAISADKYNTSKKTGWKIPRDITSTYSEVSKKIEINPIGLPRDMTYQVRLSGYKDLNSDDLRWYMRSQDPDGGGCDINSWDPNIWKRVTTKNIVSPGDSGEKTYKLDMKTYPSGSCLVAGIGGDFEYINYDRLGKFTATGSVTDMLSPEYDMQSRIEFDFSTDIFADSGTLYSDAYIEHRHREKVEFLKKLSISAGIIISEDNLELSPNKAIIYANLIE